jgi:hypothetical protein
VFVRVLTIPGVRVLRLILRHLCAVFCAAFVGFLKVGFRHLQIVLHGNGMDELDGVCIRRTEKAKTTKIAERLEGRRQKCEAIREKLAKAIVGEDWG